MSVNGPRQATISTTAATPVMPSQAGLVSLSTAVKASARCKAACTNAKSPTGMPAAHRISRIQFASSTMSTLRGQLGRGHPSRELSVLAALAASTALGAVLAALRRAGSAGALRPACGRGLRRTGPGRLRPTGLGSVLALGAELAADLAEHVVGYAAGVGDGLLQPVLGALDLLPHLLDLRLALQALQGFLAAPGQVVDQLAGRLGVGVHALAQFGRVQPLPQLTEVAGQVRAGRLGALVDLLPELGEALHDRAGREVAGTDGGEQR